MASSFCLVLVAGLCPLWGVFYLASALAWVEPLACRNALLALPFDALRRNTRSHRPHRPDHAASRLSLPAKATQGSLKAPLRVSPPVQLLQIWYAFIVRLGSPGLACFDDSVGPQATKGASQADESTPKLQASKKPKPSAMAGWAARVAVCLYRGSLSCEGTAAMCQARHPLDRRYVRKHERKCQRLWRLDQDAGATSRLSRYPTKIR